MHAVTFYAVVADGKVVDGPLANHPGKLEVKKVKMTHTYETEQYDDGVNEHGHAIVRERIKRDVHFQILN